jgi:hypothetical protein
MSATVMIMTVTNEIMTEDVKRMIPWARMSEDLLFRGVFLHLRRWQ